VETSEHEEDALANLEQSKQINFNNSLNLNFNSTLKLRRDLLPQFNPDDPKRF
jgi:hypothetical protein